MALIKLPVSKVGIRANLFMGGDRELVLTTGLISFALIFATYNFIGIVTGIVLWSVFIGVFRMMAKTDPFLRHVYLKHRLYKSYYPAKTKLIRKN